MASTDLDPTEVGLFALKVFEYRQGERVSLMIHLGDRLGLFRTLWGAGPVTAEQLAATTGLHPRWLLEWLRAVAAADLLETDDGDHFALSEVGAAVLADEEESLAFAAGAFTTPLDPSVVDGLADAFHTGVGLTYDDLGPSAAHQVERLLGPWARLALVPTILPRVEGLISRLQEGIRVVDIGCGAGVALLTMAEAFPSSTFVGLDPSRHAIERAEIRTAEQELTNVEFRAEGGEALTAEPGADFVLTFDCLHDMPHPDRTVAAIARALRPDGVWLCKEIRCGPDYNSNEGNPVRAMMYAESVLCCMSSAMSEPDGAGLGTLGLSAERLEAMAREHGFTSFTVHDVEDPANLYYEIRR